METILHPGSRNHLKSESPADRAFPEHTDIKLYESLFWSTFNDLPDKCKQVLLMHWSDLNQQEISNKLNTSEALAKEQTCACTQKFIQKVKLHKDYKLLCCTDKFRTTKVI